MVVDTSSQNFLPTQVSLDSISLPAAPEKEATVGTETPLSGQPVQEPEQEPGSRKGNNIISENGGGQKSYKNSKEEKEEEQEEAAPAEPIQPALPEPVPEAVTEEPSFTETCALPLAIGGGVVFAIAAAILIAVLTGKKRKRMQGMTEEPTFEPYAGGSIDSAVKVLLDDKNSPVFIGRVHGVGKRSMQQDSFGISEVEDLSTVRKKGVMAIVADGMGGLSDGERMSQMVVVTMLQGFDSSKDDAVASSTLLGLVGKANTAVNNDLGPERYGKCGSTVVAVIVRNKQLSWISVGDSHIYVYR
ncbi:MAG: protein phosphatase 2C domain-containing protein, partial [Lachnospiraceae bacterium]|nr:protein phosphatase 2C domain-containing protein [Lachnospiraceae bacterium]